MRKYSLTALLLLIASAVFRILGIFFDGTVFYNASFYVLLAVALVFELVQCLKISDYSPALPRGDGFRLRFFAFFAAVGMFISFISSAVGVYKCCINRSDSVSRTALEILLCVFALLSCISMLSCAVSFSDGNAYDFRKVPMLNVMPLMWLSLKCIIGLTDVYGVGDVDFTVMYLAVMFGIGAFYSFAYESDSDKGARAFSVFCFNSFSACAGMGALGRTMSVLHNKIAFTDENSIFILSLFLAGTFTYSLGRNALNDSLY